MMKIGLITFHAAYNYGSNFQAYALKTILERYFGKTEILNFRSSAQKKLYRTPFRNLNIRLLISDLRRLIRNPFYELSKYSVSKSYEQFISSILQVGDEIDESSSLIKKGKALDVLITGSDQIWNFGVIDFSTAYLGDFITNHSKTKLIAYAPSMGPIPENLQIADYRMFLTNYNAISVREYRSKAALENVGINNVDIVLDPTLLLTRKDYDLLLHKANYIPKINGYRKAYYYTPGRHNDFGNIAAKIAELHSLPLLADTGYHIFPIPHGSHRVHEGPLEFITKVRDAELIIGASFHLIVFAVLYHKPFYCIGGKSDSRMMSLLNLLGLENRAIESDTLHKIDDSIDWRVIDDKLDKLRKKSVLFLRKSLNMDS